MHIFSISGNYIIILFSEVSWKDAITKTILEASKTIDYISSVTVLEQKAKIDGNKIIEYYSTIDLTFSVDENRI